MPPSVWLATKDGLHRLSSSSRADNRNPVLAGHDVRTLAHDGSSWWAIVDGNSIQRSTDADARRWREVVSVSGDRATCLVPTSSGVLVGTTGAHLHRLRDGALDPVPGFDTVKGRRQWYTPWGAPPDARSLTVGPEGTVYVNVHVGGIPRSRDGGDTWEPTIDVDADVHEVLAHPERPGCVYAATAIGLASSMDAGASWTIEKKGLHATYQRAVAIGGEFLFVSVSESERGSRAALYRCPLAGGPLERCRQGLPEWFADNVNTGCVAATGNVVVLGTPDGEVYRSDDAGERWTRIAVGLPTARAVVLSESSPE